MSTNPPGSEPQGQYQQPPAYTPPSSAEGGYSSAPPPAPQYGTDTRAQKGSRTLGLIAFLAAVGAIVIGSILTFVAGMQLGTVVQYADSTGNLDASNVPPEARDALALGGLLATVGFLVMGALALWGFIQGIIAAVKNRGRGWAIAAIILAVLAVIPVIIFLGVGTAAGAAPYAG